MARIAVKQQFSERTHHHKERVKTWLTHPSFWRIRNKDGDSPVNVVVGLDAGRAQKVHHGRQP